MKRSVFIAGVSIAFFGSCMSSASSAPRAPPITPVVFQSLSDQVFVCPRHPVVLHHGLGGWGDDHLLEYFSGVAAHLQSKGVVVLETEVSPTATIEERSLQLKQQITKFLEESGEQKVNIIAHSMGGLDSRHLLCNHNEDDVVSSLTTLCTPHLGSHLVDRGLSAVISNLSDLPFFNLLGVAQLSTDAMRTWNENNDCCIDNSISLLSISATWPLPVYHPLRIGQELIELKGGGDNDGLVSVESQRAFGVHLGSVDTDHAGIIGWKLDKDHPFDHLSFYCSLVTFLALGNN